MHSPLELTSCPACGALVRGDKSRCDQCGGHLGAPVGAISPLSLDTRRELERRVGRRYTIGALVAQAPTYQIYQAERLDGAAVRMLVFSLPDPTFGREIAQRGARAHRLTHPRLIPLLDYGKLGGNVSYAAQAHESGRTLQEVLARAPLERSRALELAAELARSLEVLHDNDIALGLLTPADCVIPDLEGPLKVPAVPWFLGPLVGRTPTIYTAPELVSAAATPQSDQYTVGVLLLEALWGELPSDGASARATLSALVDKQPGDSALNELLSSLLSVDPDDRFSTTRDLVALLDHTRQAQRVRLPPSAAPTVLLNVGPHPTLTPGVAPRNPTPPPVPQSLSSVKVETPPQLPVVRWGGTDASQTPRSAVPKSTPEPAPSAATPVTVAAVGGLTLVALVSVIGLGLALAGTWYTREAPGGGPVSAGTPKATLSSVTLEPASRPRPAAEVEPVEEVEEQADDEEDEVDEDAPTVAGHAAPAAAPPRRAPPPVQPRPVPGPDEPDEPDEAEDDGPDPDIVATRQAIEELRAAIEARDAEPDFDVHRFDGSWRGDLDGEALLLELGFRDDGTASATARITRGTRVDVTVLSGTWARDGGGASVELVDDSGSRPRRYVGVLSGDLASGRIIERGKARGSWQARQ